MYIKPAPGLKIRDPDLKDYLPAEGREVPESDYWMRRIRDKDVQAATPQKAAKAPAVKD